MAQAPEGAGILRVQHEQGPPLALTALVFAGDEQGELTLCEVVALEETASEDHLSDAVPSRKLARVQCVGSQRQWGCRDLPRDAQHRICVLAVYVPHQQIDLPGIPLLCEAHRLTESAGRSHLIDEPQKCGTTNACSADALGTIRCNLDHADAGAYVADQDWEPAILEAGIADVGGHTGAIWLYTIHALRQVLHDEPKAINESVKPWNFQ
eukprot:CAMPEP_0179174610 /NCGR_PEP_ID=MMETSP0796-20121207/86211_1 /TAXON_ID=73915 /ORGANISM="Pyrodinium bahamense, Strain pbaha01" /LENGTH=209 /DNA_ID=CAMNT_0020877911 /DNA_START=235 /DNA_END=864 /DNA_ORIENTATION=-